MQEIIKKTRKIEIYHLIIIYILVNFFPILVSMLSSSYTTYSYLNLLSMERGSEYNVLTMLFNTLNKTSLLNTNTAHLIIALNLVIGAIIIFLLYKINIGVFYNEDIKKIAIVLLVASQFFIKNICSFSIVPILVLLALLFIYLIQLLITTRKTIYFVLAFMDLILISFFDGFNIFFLITLMLIVFAIFLSHTHKREHYVHVDYKLICLVIIIGLFLVKSFYFTINSETYIAESWIKYLVGFNYRFVSLSFVYLALFSLSISLILSQPKSRTIRELKLLILLSLIIGAILYISLALTNTSSVYANIGPSNSVPNVGKLNYIMHIKYNYLVFVSFISVMSFLIAIISSYLIYHLLIYDWRYKSLRAICYFIVISLLIFNVINTNHSLVSDIYSNSAVIDELRHLNIEKFGWDIWQLYQDRLVSNLGMKGYNNESNINIVRVKLNIISGERVSIISQIMFKQSWDMKLSEYLTKLTKTKLGGGVKKADYSFTFVSINFIPKIIGEYKEIVKQRRLYEEVINVRTSQELIKKIRAYNISGIIIDKQIKNDIEEESLSILNYLNDVYTNEVIKSKELALYLFKNHVKI